MTDQKLVELIRSGKSSAAFNHLYRSFPAIKRMVLANSGSSDDAEDVFHDALIILIKKITETDLKLTAQLSTYLFSVCRFVWNDELKKRKRQSIADLASGVTSEEQQEISVAIETERMAKLAERVILELKDRCRELLLLFYQGRMKLQDIAKKMGYNSENSAKNQKYKCLEFAKDRLKELKQDPSTF